MNGLGENTCSGPELDINAACGQDASCIVDHLNTHYMAFDEHNPSSALGVTIRMTDDFSIFCGECYHGFADCRVSASLYNHRVMITHDTSDVQVTMGRDAGIIFNQAAVESTFGKCYYMYDAATFTRVNRGCGCHGHSHDCGNPESAFAWQGSGTDPHVDGCACDSHQLRLPMPERTTDQMCFWRGAALDSNGAPTADQLREMVLQRIENQEGQTEDVGESHLRYRQEYWNEIVMDGAVMQQELASDPRSVVTAFVYVRGHTAGRNKANRMSQQVVADFGGPPIPVVELDPVNGARNGPFRLADASLLELTSEPLDDEAVDVSVVLAETSALLKHTPIAPHTSE